MGTIPGVNFVENNWGVLVAEPAINILIKHIQQNLTKIKNSQKL